jgi:hypothetical protein
LTTSSPRSSPQETSKPEGRARADRSGSETPSHLALLLGISARPLRPPRPGEVTAEVRLFWLLRWPSFVHPPAAAGRPSRGSPFVHPRYATRDAVPAICKSTWTLESFSPAARVSKELEDPRPAPDCRPLRLPPGSNTPHGRRRHHHACAQLAKVTGIGGVSDGSQLLDDYLRSRVTRAKGTSRPSCSLSINHCQVSAASA